MNFDKVSLYLEVSICSDPQTITGAAEIVGHWGDEAELTFETRNFKSLKAEKEWKKLKETNSLYTKYTDVAKMKSLCTFSSDLVLKVTYLRFQREFWSVA